MLPKLVSSVPEYTSGSTSAASRAVAEVEAVVPANGSVEPSLETSVFWLGFSFMLLTDTSSRVGKASWSSVIVAISANRRKVPYGIVTFSASIIGAVVSEGVVEPSTAVGALALVVTAMACRLP